MHKVCRGSFEGKFVRDMRRATVHDGSSTAWGLNERTDFRAGMPYRKFYTFSSHQECKSWTRSH